MRKFLLFVIFIFSPGMVFSQALPVDKVSSSIHAAMNDNYFFKDADFDRKNKTFIKMSESSMRAASNSPSFFRTVTSGVSWAGSLRFLGRGTLPQMAFSLAAEQAVNWYFSDSASPDMQPDQVMIAGGPTELTYNNDYVPEHDPYEGFSYPQSGPEILVSGQLRSGNRSYYEVRTYENGVSNTLVFTLSWQTAIEKAQQQFYYQIAMDKAIAGFGASYVDSIVGPVNCFWTANSQYQCFGLRKIKKGGYIDEPGGPLFFEELSYAYLYNAAIRIATSTPALPINCPGGYMFVGPWFNNWHANATNRQRLINEGRCQPDPNPVPGGDEILTLGEATVAIPEADLLKPMNPQLLMELANLLWRDASMQPGYDGVPYPGWNTFDWSLVQQQMWNQPQNWPSVDDLVQPLPEPSVNPDPWKVPELEPLPEGVLDLGPDPMIPQPWLELAPTAQMIIQPLSNLFPDLKHYEVSIPAGQCPAPSFSLFGQSYVVDSHCVLIEQNRAVFAVFMMAAFSLLSLFIVLRA